MASRNSAEKRSKQLTAVSYVALHAILSLGACGVIPAIPLAFQIPADLSVPSQCAMLAPVISLCIFAYLHRIDRKRRKAHLSGATDQPIWGLESRADASGADPGDYASPSVSRLAIHSTLAAGVIWAVRGLGTLGRLTAGMLGFAVLLGMVAVLCYAQSNRWTSTGSKDLKRDPKLWTKRELLKKATALDQLSWYTLTTGLLWAVALADPLLSIGASFVYGLLLWLYYFRWDAEELPPTPPVRTDDLQSALSALKTAQTNMATQLDGWIQKTEEISRLEAQLKQRLREAAPGSADETRSSAVSSSGKPRT